MRTSFIEHGTLNETQATEEVRIKSKSSFARRVHFTDAREEYEPSPDCSSGDETMSGESDTFEPVKDELSEESDTFEPVQDDSSGERLTRPPRGRILSGESDSKRPMDRVLSGESRNISHNLEYDVGESVGSSVDSRPQSWDNISETTSNSDMSEIAIHSLLVDWKQRGLDRETHQDPDRDRYTSDEEGTVIDNAADELELIAVSKCPTRLLPHGTVVRTNLEPSVQEATPLKKIWCVKLMDDAHAPEIMSGQMNVVKTYLKARYRLSDLLRAQRNDRMTSSLKRWIENGAPDKGDLEEDSYKILRQFYLKRKDLLYLNKDGIVACKRKEEDKVFYKYNSIVLPQLYQTELLFRSHDQMGHQGVDKVYNRIHKRFEWPGLKKACEKWIAACLSCQQPKDPRKLRFPLQSIESSGFNEVVQIDHQKICLTATGYNQVLVKMDHFTFWPDVIFLTAPKLDWGQAIGMMISVRRVVSMEPQVTMVAGSNDHLQSRGLLTRLTDGSIPSNEVNGGTIMTLLSAMAEVETAAKQRFTQNVVKVVFVLSPGYAALPELLQFVYAMVTTIAEGRFNVIIPAPNRVVDPDNYYPSRSELPAVWADISNVIQGLKYCSTTRLVLDEVLGLELSNFARLLKLRPGVADDHLLVQQVADDLWCRQMDHAEDEQGRRVRKNMTSAEEDLMAMALRTKPHNNLWLYLSPRLCFMGEDAFEHAPAVIK